MILFPSTLTPLPESVRYVPATTRTPFTWIASAPAAQFLNRVQQHVGLDRPLRVLDGHGDAGPLRGHRARQDAECRSFSIVCFRASSAWSELLLQLVALLLEALLLVLKTLGTVIQFIEDADKIFLARTAQGAVTVTVRGHLHGQPEAQAEQQQRDDELGPADPRRPQTLHQPLPTGQPRLGRRLPAPAARAGTGSGADSGSGVSWVAGSAAATSWGSSLRSRLPGLATRVAPLSARLAVLLGALVVVLAHPPHARNTCRRIAAALEKIRIPRTTTTPVDS
ncbi:hypothetical protein SPURM210S_04564 [Streptomyces purpurascens]